MIIAILLIASGLRQIQLSTIYPHKDFEKLNIERKKTRVLYFAGIVLILNSLLILFAIFSSLTGKLTLTYIPGILIILFGLLSIISMLKVTKWSYNFMVGLIVLQLLSILSGFILLNQTPTLNDIVSIITILLFVRLVLLEKNMKFREDFK